MRQTRIAKKQKKMFKPTVVGAKERYEIHIINGENLITYSARLLCNFFFLRI